MAFKKHRIAPLFCLVAATAACEPADDAATEAPGIETLRAALPQADELSINVPNSSALVGEQATFYRFTRNVSLNVNGMARNIGNLIEDVVETEPSQTDGESFAVWGPYEEPLSPAVWQVRVERNDAGQFEYQVEGWPKGQGPDAAQVVLEGQHIRGEDGTKRGEWTYFLTVGNALDPTTHDSTGEVALSYDLGAERTLEVVFTDVQSPSEPNNTSALYRYAEAADNSGTFDFISNFDVHEDEPEKNRRELVQVRSRWLASGVGQADVIASHGDLPAGQQVFVTECWDNGFARSYAKFAFPGGEETEGDLASCPFDDVQAPQFDGFDPDAFADADLVAALPAPEVFDVGIDVVADEDAELAVYYRMGVNTITSLNTHARNVLAMIRNIAAYPPSSCTDSGCQWGPWTDWDTRVSTRLNIERKEDGLFAYVLAVKAFGEPNDAWQALVKGGYVEGAEQGGFEFDLDVLRRFDASEEGTGTVRMEFARDGENRALATRVIPAEGEPGAGRYFVAVTPEGGLLDLELAANIDDEAGRDGVERLEARLRWITGGAGVADVRVTEGDIAAGQSVLAVECWDEAGVRTHFAYASQPIEDAARPEHAPACVIEGWQAPERHIMSDEPR